MIKRKILIHNRTGIHARPASKFVQLAGRFQCDISISTENETANAKSIIKVLGMGITQGTMVTLSFSGPDELRAAEEITKFLDTLTE